MRARCYRLLAVVVVALCCSNPALAWPDAWAYWRDSAPASATVIDHQLWRDFLAVAVVHDEGLQMNLLRYRTLVEADKRTLRDYLQAMQALDPRVYNRNEQMAYWINLYNALTVQVVLDHPDKRSIRDMGEGWFSRGPWKDQLAIVSGQKITLDDIEHRILRAIWQDRRIHFAVNCASISCPDLAAEPYSGASLERLLAQAEAAYIRHPRGVTIAADSAELSSIFNWYATDFAVDESALLDYLATHLPATAAAQLRSAAGEISYVYDWSLNGQQD